MCEPIFILSIFGVGIAVGMYIATQIGRKL